MRTVYRYDIPLCVNQYPAVAALGDFYINAPHGSKAVHVGIQPSTGIPSIWMEVESTYPVEKILFHLSGTGIELPIGLTYLGSFVKDWFVGHVYTY